MKSRLAFLVLAAMVVTGCTPTSSTTTTAAGSTTTVTLDEESSTTSEPTATTFPGAEELPEGLRDEIAFLIPLTEEIRGLEFLQPPVVKVLTAEELAERVRAEVDESYEDPEVDEALYKLLGLVPPDFDLIDTVLSLYGSSVVGAYDGDLEELVVTAGSDQFSPYEEATLVHELTHALTDQVLDFNERLNELFDEERFDEGGAFQALIEGDASLAQLLYVQQLDQASQQEFLEEAFAADTSVFDQVPPFMQDSLTFPYDTGFRFVEHLYSQGDFASIDEAYAAPPVSSEQVIWPDDYPVDVPVEVSLPANELDGYEINETSTWGELGFRLMFDQVLGGAEDAAAGWGGDSYRLYSNGTEVVFVLVFEGDSAADSDQLAAGLNEYVTVGMDLADPVVEGAAMTYSGGRFAFVATAGDRTVFIAASDPAVGPEVRGWFPEF